MVCRKAFLETPAPSKYTKVRTFNPSNASVTSSRASGPNLPAKSCVATMAGVEMMPIDSSVA